MMSECRLLTLCLLVVVMAGEAVAEQRITVGNNYDVVFGGTNQGSFTSTVLQQDIAPFYGFYPSVDLRATGSNTQLDMSYLALIERYEGDQKLNSLSHAARMDYVFNTGRVLKLQLGGYFSSAPDYTSVDVLQGAAQSPELFRFVFQPSTAESTRRTLRGRLSAQINLNLRSFLTVEASGMMLRYLNDDLPVGLLLDQNRNDFRAGYSYRLNPTDSIDVRYGLVQNDYNRFGDGRTQAAVVGYTRSFSPSLQIRVEGGPAYTRFERIDSVFGFQVRRLASSYGYTASAQVRRKIRSSNLTASYYHTPGDSSGLGSLSEIHTMGLAVFSPLGEKLSVGSSFSGFFGRGSEDGVNDYKGFYASLDLSYGLSRRWFLTWGGSYRLNSYGNPLDQEFKRLYMSLRFRAPELWRTSL